MPGTLFVVATPIGNLEDITARALRILRSVAVIAAEDTRRTAHLLAHYGITTKTTSLHEHNETHKTPGLLDRIRGGDDVALVSDAGTPTISDPGQRLVRAAIDAGLRVEPIPGPSAVLTAVAGSGFAGPSVTFLGFAPTKSSDRARWLERVASAEGLVVFFEAPHRIQQTLGALSRAIDPTTPTVVGRELTKAHEEWVRGPISGVLSRINSPIGEFTVVLDMGHTTDKSSDCPNKAIDWAHEFCEITKSGPMSRRRAVNILSRRTGVPPNEVYAAIEKAKKSGT